MTARLESLFAEFKANGLQKVEAGAYPRRKAHIV